MKMGYINPLILVFPTSTFRYRRNNKTTGNENYTKASSRVFHTKVPFIFIKEL